MDRRDRHLTTARSISAWLLVSVMLLTAALACNLEIGADDTGPRRTPVPTVERPTVEILEPAEGQTFTQGQTISVRARASSSAGITLIELLVNNVRVASQPPAEAINPPELAVVLDYQAQQTGTLVLAVRAYSNAIVSQPAQRTVQVVGDLEPGDGGQGGDNTGGQVPVATATPYNPQCRARINTGLNFRTGPSTDFDIILTFSAGQEPPITGYADLPEGRWWQVLWGGQVGWISAAYATALGECGALRPAAVPATPTVAPTITPLPTQPGTTATPTLPDLQLSLLEAPTEVQLGPDGTVTERVLIRVTNNGGRTSAQFRLAVLLPDGSQRVYDVPGLNPNQEFQVPSEGVPVVLDTPGVARVLVTVDDQNVVAESNESNNQAYRDITVLPAPNTGGETGDTGSTGDTDDTGSADSSPADGGDTAADTPVIEPPPAQDPQPPADTGDTSPVVLAPITAANAGRVSELHTLLGHNGVIESVDFSPGGDTLITASRDGTVRLWDMVTYSERAMLTGHTDRVTGAVFSPDGTRAASSSWDGTVRIWDVGSGAELLSLPFGAEVDYVAFSPNGTQIAGGGLNGSGDGGLAGLVRIWDAATGTEIGSVETFGPVSGLAFLPTGELVVSTNDNDCNPEGGGTVELFTVGSANPAQTYTGHSGSLDSLATGLNGSIIAAGGQANLCSGAGRIFVWNTGGSLVTTLDLGVDTRVTGIAISPTGDLLVSSSMDGLVRIWDLSSGAQLATLSGHSNGALAVDLRPSGTLVASGGGGNTVRLWGTDS